MDEKRARINYGLVGWQFVMQVSMLVVCILIGKRIVKPL